MLDALSIPVLALIFMAAVGVVWAAGVWLSDTTDIISTRFHLGEALGGIILLAIGTNLPEIAITASAALHHNIGIAIGNLLGGIAIQTVVLVALDAAGKGKSPLTYRAASLTLVLEAALVVVVLAISILGTRLPTNLVFWRMTPQSLLIVAVWLAGIWMLKAAPGMMSWKVQDADAPSKPARHSQNAKDEKAGSSATVLAKFAAACLATLAAGVALEGSGDALAGHFGMSGVLFGATVLAASTSTPELATGITSIRMGDDRLAISDIFGGNAFLPVLFLLASLLSGESVLPHAQNTDVYLAALGIAVTAIYMFGLILRPAKRYARVGIDSWLVLLTYSLGMAGLIFVKNGK
ncbi:MAG: sodium:calcium antiporter [Janthinobacterium lividum]